MILNYGIYNVHNGTKRSKFKVENVHAVFSVGSFNDVEREGCVPGGRADKTEGVSDGDMQW
jgi:hypothetical protein